MLIFELFLPPQAYAGWRLARRTSNHRFAAARNVIATWIERARQRQALAGLDNRQLRDIGITRLDAARECEKPFWR